MAHLILRRVTNNFGVLRRLNVFIDGVKVGSIANASQQDFPVEMGHHEIFVKMDWCVSHPLILYASANAVIELECGCNFELFDGWRGVYKRRRNFFYIRAITPPELTNDDSVWPPPPSLNRTT